MRLVASLSLLRNVCFAVLLLAVVTSTAMAQTNASLSGTYTVVVGFPDKFQVQANMFGQQVGFCSGSMQLPAGYRCFDQRDQNVLTGTLVADGNGNVITGSTYTFTVDPNAIKCSSSLNATPDCPYKVPSGIAWSNTGNYVVGDEVDVKNSVGTLVTYQAVKNNIGVFPTNSLCTQQIQPPNCDWVQLYKSAVSTNNSSSGTFTGKYTVQSNGSGVLQVVPSTYGKTISFSMIVPLGASAIGQEVPLVITNTLGSDLEGSGTAVRVK